MEIIELESERLIYRPISFQHCTETYVSWLNDFDVYEFLETGGDYDIAKLKNYISVTQADNIYFWGIHLKSSNKHIGNIKIDPISKRHLTGEYGIMMGDKSEWGKGYAKEASQRVIDFCFFEGLNLRKITLGVVEENNSAVHLYKKLGFTIEGEYKYHYSLRGKFLSVLRMALFNAHYVYP